MVDRVDWGLYKLHQNQRRAEQAARYGRGEGRRTLARRVELDAVQRMRGMGYQAGLTTPNARYDVLVGGCCRIEVKAARWHQVGEGGGRYQACLHNVADLVLFCCVNGALHYFVLPAATLEERRNIAVWSYHPAEYKGRWAPFLEDWERLAEAVDAARSRPRQLAFL